MASFAHPGGNIKEVTAFSTELTANRIELRKERVPNFSRVALLHNRGNPAAYPTRGCVEAGGLTAHAANYPNLHFRLASIVDNILKGAKPASLYARLGAALLMIALGACSHTLPRDSGSKAAAADNDDPWIVRGSIEVGPTYGSPQGPYSPRQ
jgi:ABC-type uncharacterized transport system substrate-binding protein